MLLYFSGPWKKLPGMAPNGARRICFLLIETLPTFWAELVWILIICIFWWFGALISGFQLDVSELSRAPCCVCNVGALQVGEVMHHTADSLQVILQEFDKNCDGAIDFDEFMFPYDNTHTHTRDTTPHRWTMSHHTTVTLLCCGVVWLLYCAVV